MKKQIRKTALLLGYLLCTIVVTAQEARFKLGVGANYISNNYEEVYLNDYAALSLNTSYALLQQPKFSVVWEQNFLLRQRADEQSKKTAFIVSLPLTFRVHPGKTAFYAGLGPAYLAQRYEDYSIRQRVRGLHATALAGVAVRSQPFAEVMFLEYHFRAGVHRSLGSSSNMAPFLSVMVQLGANKRMAQMTNSSRKI